MKLVGANEHAKVTGLGRLTGKSNYFVGNDPKKWRTNVANYSRVKYQDVYPGIDLVYYGNQGHLEYDFVVSPGADPRAIAFEIDGADRAVRESPTRAHRDAHLRIDPAGDLVIATDDGDVRLHKPVVYQPTIDKLQSTTDALNPKSKIANPKYLDGRFILAVNNQVTFEVGSYDKTLPLVIDPVLSYSTFLGGSGGDSADGIAVDASGNAYVTGSTSSVEFPTVAGSFDTSCGTDGNCNLNAPFGGGDIFVTKLNAAGTALVYSTYLGGSDRDTADGIAVDSSGNAYLSGTTQSADFPTTGGAFRTAFAGGFEDAFVTKLNAAGTALVYSTYLGGSEQDEANGIAVGSSGNVYLSGTTSSTNFPTSGGVLQPACVPGNLGQCNDAFVAKVNTAATGSASLVYSTFLGGSEIDFGGAIAVDTSGNAYIAAATHSPDFPVRNPFQPNNRGGIDAYVTKLNATGSGLIYSTYLGGGADDYAFGIAVDSTGNIYVSGRTDSDNFPATPGAFQTACAGGSGGSCQDAFVAKLNPAGSSLIYSTFLGGSDNEESFSGMAIDSLGNAYVSGETYSVNFPKTSPLQPALRGPSDAFLAKLNATGSALIFSTYLGGDDRDSADGVAVYSGTSVYIAGGTVSTNFPITAGAFDTGCGTDGQCNFDGQSPLADAFVAKVSFPAGPTVLVVPSNLAFGDQLVNTMSTPQPVTLTNTGNAALAIYDISASGDFNQSNSCGSGLLAGSSCNISVSFTPTATGSRTGTLIITDSAPGSPHAVPLNGTGVSTTGGTATVSLSPLSLYLGDPIVGATVGPLPVTLTNTGDGPLQVFGCSKTGTNAADFNINGCAAGTYSPGTALPIAVSFTPTAVGERTATLSVNTNVSAPQVILSGFGMAEFHQCDGLPSVPVNFDGGAWSTCAYGCALTSTGSALTTFNTTVNPSTLDNYLTPDGYNPNGSGNLYWPAIPLFPVLGGSLQLIDSRDIQPQEVNGYLSDHILDQQQRVVLRLCFVSGTQCGPDTHFVVATGPTGSNDWRVFDPGWKNADPQANLSTLSGHIDGFTTSGGTKKFQVTGVRTFVPSADARAFSVQGQSPVELLVTDPEGRRLGNAGTGGDIFEIPLGSYFRDFPLASDDDTGPSLGDPTGLKTAYMPSPLDGTYTAVATGTASGSYTLDIQAVASDGTVQTESVTGVTAPGSAATYEVTYSSTPGTPPGVTRLPTGPIASLSATARSFGNQLVGATSATQTVTLTNTGNPELVITGLSVSGDFTPNSTCGSMLAVNGSCSISITFMPTAAGNRTGTLTINDNAPGSPHTVALSGTGTDFALGTASDGSTSTTVNAGQTASYKLQIAPTGFSGTVALGCTWNSQQPRGANCTVSSPSADLDGTNPAPFTVSVSTTARSVASPRPDGRPPLSEHPRGMPLAVLLLGLLMLIIAAVPRKRHVSVRLGLVMALIVLWVACGGGGGATPPPQTGTPAGTYTLTVSGTASGVSRTATLTLKVN